MPGSTTPKFKDILKITHRRSRDGTKTSTKPPSSSAAGPKQIERLLLPARTQPSVTLTSTGILWGSHLAEELPLGRVAMPDAFSLIIGALEHLLRVPAGESTSIAVTGFIDIHMLWSGRECWQKHLLGGGCRVPPLLTVHCLLNHNNIAKRIGLNSVKCI